MNHPQPDTRKANLAQFEQVRKRKLICYVPNCASPECRRDHPCDCPDLDTEYAHLESDHD